MKKYLVGGCVRDKLLGLPSKDRDWVIVGASEWNIKNMLIEGYEQVGNSFPVYIHPKTREEYALARTERKTGSGHTGFTCDANKNVTLEEDLFRRDITINAIAFDPYEKKVIDPYNGQRDLKDKIIRHVSPAFAEDPLRVLRTARFAARFDFKIHESTEELMKQIVEGGELLTVPKERVYNELRKVFEDSLKNNSKVSTFFKALRKCGALKVLFPELKVTNELLDVMDKLNNYLNEENFLMVYFGTLMSFTNISEVYNFCERYTLHRTYFRFTKCLDLCSGFKNITQKSPREISELFFTLSIKNKGSEEYLYLLLDVCNIMDIVQKSDNELIMRLYDAYESVDLTNMSDLIKEQKLQRNQINELVISLREKKIAEILK